MITEVYDTLKAAATGDDANRLAARRDIRKQMAECSLARTKLRELDQQVKSLDSRADRAADRHQEVCTPARQRLQEIEEMIVSADADRVAADPIWEQQRAEQNEKILAANASLEVELAAIKIERGKLAANRNGLSQQTAMWSVCESKLTLQGTARDDLFCEWYGSTNAADVIDRATSSLRDRAAVYEGELRDAIASNQGERRNGGRYFAPEQLPEIERKCARANSVVSALTSVSRDLRAKANRTREEMISE